MAMKFKSYDIHQSNLTVITTLYALIPFHRKLLSAEDSVTLSYYSHECVGSKNVPRYCTEHLLGI